MFKGVILEYLDILILYVIMMTSELMMRLMCDMSLFNLQSFIFNTCIYLMISSIMILFKRKTRAIITILMSLFFTGYTFAQSLHYAFFTSFFSYRKLTVINELFEVKGEVIDKLDYHYLIFLLPLLLLFGLKLRKSNEIISKKRFVVTIILLPLCLGIRYGSIQYLRADYLKDKSWNKDYYLHEVMQNRIRFMDRFGMLEYNIMDLEMTLKPSKVEYDEKMMGELDEFVKRHSGRKINEMSDVFKGKNLILILCESLDENAIRKDITPTLYKMATEGVYFSNHYAPIYQVATGDSEFIANTGMLPSIDYGTTSYTFNLNSYPYALANLFKDNGYDAKSFHSYTANFYNRESIHESFGYSVFYDMDKLGLERWEDYKDTRNWIEDEKLFDKVLDYTDTDGPFFDFVVTVGGHMPYYSSRSELKDNYEYISSLEKYQNLSDESKYYLSAQMLLDHGLEKLLEELKDKNLLEDTIIWMFADHYPYGIKSDAAKKELLSYREGEDIYRVPMLIYGDNLNSLRVNTYSSTFDIYPTLLNMFAIESDGYYVGSDIFSDDLHMVIFEDRSILTDRFYFDADEDILSAVGDDKIDKSDTEYYLECDKKVNDIFEYGQKILLSDYYKEKGD